MAKRVNPQSFGYMDLDDIVFGSSIPVEMPEEAVTLADIQELSDFTGLNIDELMGLNAADLDGLFADMESDQSDIFPNLFDKEMAAYF